MSNFLRNYPAQIYLSLIPLGIGGYLGINSYRDNVYLRRFLVSRSEVEVPVNYVDVLEQEFTSLALKNKKRFRNTNFKVSLIDNLEARTYGSFKLDTGAEFQVPVISTLENVADLRTRFPNLVDLVKELKLKATIETSTISDGDLQSILLSESARNFSLRREITQAESLSHLVVPSVVGSAGVLLGYPVFLGVSKVVGGYVSLVCIGAVALYFTYHMLCTELKTRILAMDNRILEEDMSLIKGAIEYIKARLAFGRLLHEQGGELAKAFDKLGNCSSQYVKYTDRLKQFETFVAEEKQKSKVNVRAL